MKFHKKAGLHIKPKFDDTDPRIGQSVTKALLILQCFTQERPYLRLKEISELSGITAATTSRLLSTMKAQGFVDQEENKYCLGWRMFLRLEGVVLQSIPILRKSVPFLEQLAFLLRRNVNFAVLDGTEVVYLHRSEGEEGARGYYHTGMRRPAYCTALGKVLLADMPEQAEQIFSTGTPRKLTLATITNRDQFMEQLNIVRLQGYATEEGECINGFNCIAVPVYGQGRRVLAALSISGSADNFRNAEMKSTLPYMQEMAVKLSVHLGGGQNDG